MPGDDCSKGVIPTTAADLDEALEMGMDWSVREGYAWAEDKEHCEEFGRMLNADPSKVRLVRLVHWPRGLFCFLTRLVLTPFHMFLCLVRQVSKRAKKRGLPQLGTLGAGNHYCEIQVPSPSFSFF